MNHKLLSGLLVLVLCLTMLTGCAQALPAADIESAQDSDIFQETTIATVSNVPTESTAETKEEDSDLGGFSCGLGDGLASSSVEPPHYSGGEAELTYYFDGHGRVPRAGIGLLLFLDGRPQPYRIEGETEYTYLHVFSINDERITPKLYLLPVTGHTGDTLEMTTFTLLNPNYRPSQGDPGMMVFTSGSGGVTFPFYMDADAPAELKMPEKLTLLSEPEITYEPCAPQDVLGWENDDFQIKYGHESEVNGLSNGRNVFENFHKEALDLKYSLWGTTLVHYTVVYFLNNEPLYLQDGSCLDLEVQDGMKTVARLTMDTSTLTGEDVFYAVLVPRNARFTTPKTDAFVVGERTWFLLSGDMPTG